MRTGRGAISAGLSKLKSAIADSYTPGTSMPSGGKDPRRTGLLGGRRALEDHRHGDAGPQGDRVAVRRCHAEFRSRHSVLPSADSRDRRQRRIGRTYVTEHNAFKDGRRAFTIGLYHERYRGDADRWRFTWRFFDLFYMGPADLSKPFLPIPHYGQPPWHPDPERRHLRLQARSFDGVRSVLECSPIHA